MFSELMKRSNAVWIYSTGRFAEERRSFLCDMVEHGSDGWCTLRQTNRLLLAVAERVNVRQRTPISDRQIVQAANDWVSTTCSPKCKESTRATALRRFQFVAKEWLRFLGKWSDAERDAPFKTELDGFLGELRDQRGYSPETISTRESGLKLFFDWLQALGIGLADLSPKILESYFVQNKAHGWKKSTIKVYGNSIRAFLLYASRQGWCSAGLAETITSPRIYSMTDLPAGPPWEQVQRLIANLNTENPSDIRARAVVLLLAIYGLRIGEVCKLTLDDLDWQNEKIRLRRPKNKRTQEFPLTTEVGNAILKYLQQVRPQCTSRSLFLTLRRPFRPMESKSATSTVSHHLQTLGAASRYGSHVLRHACASHLLDEGFSIKEIGDHLGHRSTRSTQIYAKVDRKKLALVADTQLSGLTEFFRAQSQPITSNWAKDRVQSLREVSELSLGGVQ